ncbi:MAG: LPS export ABC transporter periplasmic protein LptC [Gallionellales bacterium RIFOXYB12_FULL_54_9]|nr:MAG: LPS export ABC transporter periplasmic protein LptC [Gallionellales bacterium RIFOXYB12_FULL_54_9]
MTVATRTRYWLPLLPLLGLLAFVYWLDSQVQQEVAAAINNQRHDPDVIMGNFSSTKMDQSGVPGLLLSARQLRHYPDHDTTELDLPYLTMLSDEHPAVHMRGNRGNISSRGDEVVFQENVSVLREADNRQAAMTLNTHYLRVLPEQEWANTDKAVTIKNASTTISAVGLEMDNKVQTLKLLSHVRSESLPNAK